MSNGRESYLENTTRVNGPRVPDSWSWTSIGESLQLIDYRGRTPPFSETGIPHLRSSNIKSGKVLWEKLTYLSESDYDAYMTRGLPKQGDVIFTTEAPLGEVALAPDIKFSLAQRLLVLRPLQGSFRPKFLAFQLMAPDFQSVLRLKGTGSTVTGVSSRNFKMLSLCVAPLNEQDRIASKIEELFSDLEAGVAALRRAKANLKRYRAAVLKAAVEGDLTAEWRAQHPDTDPASQLLTRILQQRREKWEADQLAKVEAASRRLNEKRRDAASTSTKEPPKNWRDKYVEPSPPDTSGLPKLPKGWCWASVQQAGSVQLGRQRAPQHHNGPNMRPYLRVANVFEDRIDIRDVMEMNFTPDEFETYRLRSGDILLNEGQSMELIGRPAMYRGEVPDACFTNTLVRFVANKGIDPHYALKVFLAYLKNGRFQKIATITVNIAHLGAGRLSEIEFPVPPIEEQAAIIEEVDRHFSLIDAAEKSIEQSLKRAARLRQSILQQAFTGQLVPQDPTDEPASTLLERLRVNSTARSGYHDPATTTLARKPRKKAAPRSERRDED